MKIKLFIIVAGLFLSLLIVPGIIYAQSWCHTFNTNLGTGESGSIEVAYLHVALLAQNISYGNDGLTDYSTGTIAGVTAFQERYASEILAPWGLTHGTGYTGTTTRAKLNQLYGCSTTPSGCTEQWQCTGWGSCYNGSQTQTCTDYNFCGTTVNKPATSRSCSSSTNTNNTNTCQATCITQLDGVYAISCSGSPTKCSSNQTCEQTFSTSYDYSSGYVQTTQTLTGAHCTYSSSNNNNSNNTNNTCTTDWDCGSWSACVNKQQTKTCTDLNNCGTTTNKPAESQYCCEPLWDCGSWSSCSNKQQTRTCADWNSCGTTSGKPAESQYCCESDWSCGNWGICSAYGQQTRICTDANSCGITTGKPETTQSCTCTENWQCGSWSSCYNSQQTRFCYDVNHCGTTLYKLYTKQSCTPTCSPNYVCSQQPACKNNQIQSYCYDTNQCFALTDFRYCGQ